MVGDHGERDADTTLTTDALFAVFSHVSRRAVMVHLRQHDVATLDELVDAIFMVSGDEFSESDRSQIRTSLVHTHLPRLQESGLVAYDADAEVVEATDVSGEIGEWLDLAVRRDLKLEGTTEVDAPAADRETIRVLLVDDEPGLPETIAAYIERHNDDIEVTIARNVREALRTLESASFDCIVSDYQMPALSGLDFLQAVREEDPTIPFLLFTAKGSETTASQAISKGVTDYVRKGGSEDQFDELAERIRSAVDWA